MQTIRQVCDYLLDFNYTSVVFRLVLAAICSGIIGIERGKRQQAAGFRTYILVGIGAALASSTNIYIIQLFGGDSTRISAQIISGIGFLGAGTILVTSNNRIRGLTTAAGLWASGAMGLAIGVGFYIPAISACVLIMLTMTMLNKIEKYFYSKSKVLDLFVEFESVGNVSGFLSRLQGDGIRTTSMELAKAKTDEASTFILMTIFLPKYVQHTELIAKLLMYDGVKFIEEV